MATSENDLDAPEKSEELNSSPTGSEPTATNGTKPSATTVTPAVEIPEAEETGTNAAQTNTSSSTRGTTFATVTPIPPNLRTTSILRTTSSMPAIPYTGPYDLEEYQIEPNPSWPPPIFIRKKATPQERFYIENRWYSQWTYFDKRANENKTRYFIVQLFIGVGSVVVPSLVSLAAFAQGNIGQGLDVATVFLSLSIAIAATLESLNQYGEFWRSYRQAAEELLAEKTYYDMRSGMYYKNSDPFSTFVQRCEEIMAKQNGRFIQSVERQQAEAEQQIDSILSDYRDDDNDTDRSTTTSATG